MSRISSLEKAYKFDYIFSYLVERLTVHWSQNKNLRSYQKGDAFEFGIVQCHQGVYEAFETPW